MPKPADLSKLDRDILRTLRLFASQHPHSRVPFDELLSQLLLLGHWPLLRKGGKLDVRVYRQVDHDIADAMDRLRDAGLVHWEDASEVGLTEQGEAVAIG